MSGPPEEALPRLALWLVAAVTLARIALLAVLPLDLWVDEAQYWLWGQHLDLGYFSKPPLIGWVIRAATAVLGDSTFAIRLPGPLFHGATALLLGQLALRLWGARAGLWTAITYVTLPMTALGSVIISTDTILAPFFAAALLFHLRAARRRSTRDAALAGAMLGLAFLAKYAALYYLPGALIAAALSPDWRLRWRDAAVMAGVFLLLALPNVGWNLTHGLVTLEHTADNIEWVEGDGPRGLNWAGLAGFLATQFAVAGPVVFAALLLLPFRRPGRGAAALLGFALPVLALVSVQALLAEANGNWAVVAFFAGTAAVAPWLALRHRRWAGASLVINGALCLLVPALFLAPGALTRPSGRPYLDRYMNRAAMAERVLDLARDSGAQSVVASDRGLLADLFYTGRDSGLALRATPPRGAPEHYYAQLFPWTPADPAPALLVTRAETLPCTGAPLATLAQDTGAWSRVTLHAFLVQPDCAADLE